MSGEGDMWCDKDPGIMLFGRKIPVPEFQIPASSQMGCQIQSNSTTMNACSNLKQTRVVEMPRSENSEQSKNSSDSRDIKQESLHNVQEENESKVNTRTVEDNIETSSSTDQEKVFKKPDKILHCPRCSSLDTKFCYFNNYNVNQPRYFCKNCQRYWTAGGTMRNVPVGAGRRKNKHISSQYRHMIVSTDGIPTARSSTDNGTVLKFGSDAPHYDSMESMLNLRNHKTSVNHDPTSTNCAENGEEEVSLCGSSLTNAYAQGNESSEHNNRSNPLQCYPVPPWVLPWNPSNWNNVASMVQSSLHMFNNPYSSTGPASMQWCPAPPMMAVPTIFPPNNNTPLQFVPAGSSYWHGAVSIGSNGTATCLSPSNSSTTSNSGSPTTLGKHTRDHSDEERSEMCVFVPKTLRIDDPNEASKSTLGGIKQDQYQKFVSECGISKRIEHKGEGKDRILGCLKSWRLILQLFLVLMYSKIMSFFFLSSFKVFCLVVSVRYSLVHILQLVHITCRKYVL